MGITLAIASLPLLDGMSQKDITATDGCAGVGGQTMSFVVSEKFHTVNSVECNETRSQMLTKNIDTITHPNNQTQSNVLTNNYLEVMHSINQNIVSLTPLSEAPDTSITRKLCFFFFVKTPGRYSERCTSQTQNKVLDFQSSGEFRQQLLHKQT